MKSLEEAHEIRENTLLELEIEQELDRFFALSAKTVGPEARMKLRHLLSFYAKKKHPFRACVKDNMKRFGPGRTEAVCATLKDLIEGTTKWRKGRQSLKASDEFAPYITDEVLEFLESMPEDEIERIVAKMGELNE